MRLHLTRLWASCALAALMLLPGAGTAAAQSTFGSSVRGTVQDTAGVAVPGVTLAITNLNDNTTRNVTSDAAGAYVAQNLMPGSYEIVATKYGFTSAKARIVLDARRNLRTDLKLALAAVGEGGSADSLTAAAIAKELDGMKGRFEELETLLKTKLAQEQGAASNSAPATLLATTTKDPSELPPLPAPLAKPRDLDTIAANTPVPGAPLPSPSPAPQAPTGAQTPDVPPAAPAAPDLVTPFADYDWTWLNGNSRQHDSPLDSKYFSPEIPGRHLLRRGFQSADRSLHGRVERSLPEQRSPVGGSCPSAAIFTPATCVAGSWLLFGMFAATTVRNDASPAVGQWDVRAAYKYVSEAYGGYHFNVQHGLNIDAGIFVSYVGLFSYHNFDNWAYQPSYVSSNTPWFFNGVRIQWFPTHHLKIEPWFINGWQSYNRFNGHPGLGGQLKVDAEIVDERHRQPVWRRQRQRRPSQSRAATTPTTASRSNTTTSPRPAMASTGWRSRSRATWDAKPATE